MRRYRLLNAISKINPDGPIVYWMSRDQRVADNWALLFAQELSQKFKLELKVIFNFMPTYSSASDIHYKFMIEGLKEVEFDLEKLNIPFDVLIGNAEVNIEKYCIDNNISALVCDFSPLRIAKNWKNKIKTALKIPFYEVDTHNVIPAFLASDIQEYNAYTFRLKVNRKIDEYLTDIGQVKKQTRVSHSKKINWNKIIHKNKQGNIAGFTSGTNAANLIFDKFINHILKNYASKRNDPNENMISALSPYLHFGQISAQRIAFELNKLTSNENTRSFLEELIIRKELADNFCYYNEYYDSIEGFPEWAKRTLQKHLQDKREFVYTLEDFENARTHDELWNAAQVEMKMTNKMHGYMRMYWAKKILEWSMTPQEALKNAIYLNDKYEIDGRDPNGYTGIAWSIGGVHDRPWFERPVYGTVRYMNALGAARKFDVDKYINKYLN